MNRPLRLQEDEKAKSATQMSIDECLGIFLAGLDLPRDCVEWVQGEEGWASARDILK